MPASTSRLPAGDPMNIAYLLDNVVLLIGPEGWVPPEEFVFDATRDATGANIGDTWDGSRYVSPVVQAPPVTEIPRADFRRRFTPAEAWAAKQLADTDPVMAY